MPGCAQSQLGLQGVQEMATSRRQGKTRSRVRSGGVQIGRWWSKSFSQEGSARGTSEMSAFFPQVVSSDCSFSPLAEACDAPSCIGQARVPVGWHCVENRMQSLRCLLRTVSRHGLAESLPSTAISWGPTSPAGSDFVQGGSRRNPCSTLAAG